MTIYIENGNEIIRYIKSMEKLKNFNQFINEALFNIKQDEYEKSASTMANLFAKYKNAKELPKGSKKGPQVSNWLRVAGAQPGQNWCMAFVYGIFDELAGSLGITNPLPKTAGVMDHWDKTDPSVKINVSDVRSNADLLKPGMIFIMHRAKAHGQKNLGHAGIVISTDPVKKTFTSIEGNTNDMASGQGGRVGINTRRMDDPLLVGFTDYFKDSRTPEFEDALTKEFTTVLGDDVERIKFKNPITHS